MNVPLPKTFFRLLGYFLRDYRLPAILFVTAALAAGLWSPLNSYFIKQLINALPHSMSHHGGDLVLWGSLIVLNFIVFDNITWRVVGYLCYKYEGQIKNTMTKTLLNYVLDSSHQFFQDNLSGRIASHITTFSENAGMIVSNLSRDLFRGISLLLGSLVASFTVNVTFTVVIGVWMLLFGFLSVCMSQRFIRLSDTQAKNESMVSGQLVDIIANHGNVRLFSRKGYELSRAERFFGKLLKSFKAQEGFAVFMLGVQGTLIVAMIAVCVAVLVHLYHAGLVNAGDFALILGLTVNLAHMMWYTMWQYDLFNRAYGKCKQSLSAIMQPHEIVDKPDAVTMASFQGDITFDKVDFWYKGSDPLFQQLSLSIKSGEKVGLVGFSGSGKTSFVHLILRLYDITGGVISIGGRDIASVTQSSLREHIAMIPQDPSLFHRSLMDNIRYSRPDASDEEVIEASKQAHAHGFITQLPEGYESLVGERGIKLSGGQRQRVAVARAILKNAPLLILDEATSQLDSVTEHLIQESLWGLMQGRTTLIIAHRLSTLLQMDRILVFDKGAIVEDGTHKDLLKQGGLYKTLWDAQVGGFLGDAC